MSKNIKIAGKKFQLLTKWYLRFNGYFSIDNFMIHDSLRIMNDRMDNLTDIDVLGIRKLYQFE